MNEVKYIVLDFDGTILNSKLEVSDNLVNKLIDMQKKGYKVVLCSGRSLHGIQWVAQKIDLAKYSGFIVAYNGAEIYEYSKEKINHLYSAKFSAKQVEDISSLIKDDVQSLMTYCDNKMGVTNHLKVLDKSSKVMGLEITKDYIKESPKIVLFDEPQNISSKYSFIKNKVISYDNTINVFSSIPHLLEITPKDALKGSALQFLANYTNCTNDQFICFGDGENDLSMFIWCKYSVAMENAILEVKDVASHHTLSNNEDGVYCFLQKNFS